MPAACQLCLTEIPLAKRSKTKSIEQLKAAEGRAIIDAIPARSKIIALEVQGAEWSTEQLASNMQDWLSLGDPISLLVGGPDGLAPECLDAAQQKWSLSKLTLPHPLVRVVLAEQLYRAWSLLNNHPYHRD